MLLIIYFLTFGLLFASLTTYFDWLYKNRDNLWLSGFFVGLSAMPLLWWGIAFSAIIGRAFLLAIVWGGLNKIEYDRILFWRRDVIEEFVRYASIIATLPLLL